MKTEYTQRGFSIIKFTDTHGVKCSIQESSVIPHLWLGTCENHMKVLAKDAHIMGIETTQTTGWVDIPIPPEALVFDRMHLTRKHAKKLAKILKYFGKHGQLPEVES